MVKPEALTREKALALLVNCRKLALKLEEKGHGMDIALAGQEDRQTLKGFEVVWLAGWLSDPTLQIEAGLSPVHVAILGYLLAQEQK